MRSASRIAADSVELTNVVLLAVGVFGLLLTSRYLGVSDRGEYLTWSSWSALIGTTAMLGTEAFVVVAAHESRTRVSVRTFWPILSIGVAVAGLLSTAVMWFVASNAAVVVGGALVAMSGPVVALHSHVQQANGNHDWRFNLSRALAPLVGFTFLVVCAVTLSPSASGLFLGLGLGLSVGAGIALVIAWQPATPVPGLIRRWIELAGRGAPLTVLTWLLLNVDTVVVSIYGDSTDVGLYGVGVAARGAVFAVGSAVGLRWYATRGGLHSFPRIARSFIPSIALAAATALAAPIIVPLALGRDFSPAVRPVQILAVAGIVASIDFLLGRVVLVRLGYAIPALVRAFGLVVLVSGIALADGDPTRSALAYCVAVSAVVAVQALLIWLQRAKSQQRR